MLRWSATLALVLTASFASAVSQKDGKQPDGSKHWAFQSLHKSQPPATRDPTSVRSDVDRFIVAALEARGLSLSAEADRVTLIRRVCFDLTGLPPTPQEVDAFVADKTPDAYERMVERYLASPRYGERWGQYWLDAAGYADSSGYFSNEKDRPLAYRYRDYVIDSFNRDVPFDQLVREQLAGDEMVDWKSGADASPEVVRALVATQYLSNAPDGTDQSAAQPEAMRLDRYSALEGTQQIVASSLLALSLKCARCHDHKFEPISQREYYQIQSIFLPALNPADWVPPLKRTVAVTTPDDKLRFAARRREHETRVAALKADGARMAAALAARTADAPLTNSVLAQQPIRDGAVLFADLPDARVAAAWVSSPPTPAQTTFAVLLD